MRYPNTSKLVKKTRLRLVSSTHFSVFGYLMKHSSSCLIHQLKHLNTFLQLKSVIVFFKIIATLVVSRPFGRVTPFLFSSDESSSSEDESDDSDDSPSTDSSSDSSDQSSSSSTSESSSSSTSSTSSSEDSDSDDEPKRKRKKR